jgi:hypothetical protein
LFLPHVCIKQFDLPDVWKIGFLLTWKQNLSSTKIPATSPLCYKMVGAYESCNLSQASHSIISREPFNNSPRNVLIYKWIEELCSNNDLMQVLFICCAVLVNIRKIRRVFSNMSLFLKKSYKQRYHLCYTHIGLRFTTY